MKTNKRMLSFIVALVMVVSMVSPMAALADNGGPEGSLTIHKLYFPDEMGEGLSEGSGEEEQAIPANAKPLAGAKFSIWEVADDAEMPYTPSGTADEVVTTGANGEAVFGNLPYGRYYVEETELPKGVTQGSAPFMVDIPGTSVDGDRLIDDVHVYPKNVLVLGAARLHKSNELEQALPGAIFSLYKRVEDGDDELIASDIETGSDGWTDIQEDLEVGDYYFIETEAPAGYLLDETEIGFTIAAGDHAYVDGEINEGKVKEVYLYNSEKPKEPEKEADKSDAGIGDKVRWTIKTQLPGNIDSYDVYKITDNLDAALNYDNNVVVTLDGNPLVEGTHYNLVEPATTGGGSLEINFVPGELNGRELAIAFDTIVNENAVVGVDIENKAILDYDNGFEEGSEESNIPKVKVGGHRFRKVDNNENVLEDAEFIVYKEDDGVKIYLVKDEDGMISWSTSKDDATKFISNSDGLFSVEGVAFGNYFLEEIKAPEGYALLQNPVEFTVGENTHETELDIVNRTKPKMPQTGGMGTILFTVLGIGLMAIAAKTYKREERQ